MADPLRYRFAGFEFDVATGELTGGAGEPRRLEPQPARVLALLLERAGELVTREEIQREVWPDTHVDFDQGLNYCVRQIRAALGESAEAPRLLETLPRRGYRFVGPVEVVGSVEAVGTVGRPIEPSRGRGAAPAIGPRSAARRRMLFAFVALLGIAAAISWRIIEDRPAAVAGPAPIRIAVLPFHGTDRPPTPWEDRLTEALVVALTGEGGDRVAVVGTATTAPLARERLPHGELGRRLGADFVLSGGIRSDGESVFAQLLRAPGGEHLWATVLPLGDADALGREIADAALAVLNTQAGPG